jgi:integrase
MRTVGLPHQVIEALEHHRDRQDAERQHAADPWQKDGWVFTNHLGRPVHSTVDHECWKSLLRTTVRDARLHDAPHTAATMLLVFKVPLPAVMEIMGWSGPSIAKRYMHVTDKLVIAIAHDVGELLWTERRTPTDAN